MPCWSWVRAALATALVAVALLGSVPAAGASSGVAVLVLDGTGWGHGVGLSQWGAEHLARTGRTTTEILGTFYPGAGLATTRGAVRVAIHQPGAPSTTLTFPQGGQVRSPLEGPQAPGFPLTVAPGGRVRITALPGGYRVDGIVAGQAARAVAYQDQACLLEILCGPTTTEPPPTTEPPADDPGPTGSGGGAPPSTPGGPAPSTAPPEPGDPGPPPAPEGGPPVAASSSQPVWAVPAEGGTTQVDDRGRRYRGVLEATGSPGLRLVNLVDVEDYLRGMAEVPGTWPPAAVQAQTVAARTYALRAVQASGELCDDARCQVYVGQSAETPGQDAAVAATAGHVLTYDGRLAAAVYSADAGGVSATTLEGFGTPDGVYPYLTTVRYETDNPLPWRAEIAFSDIAARVGYPGSLTGVQVSEVGPSGRALQVALEGSAGRRTVDGRTFARSLELRSTRFSAEVAQAAVAPPPPPAEEEEALQALPEETATEARTLARVVGPSTLDHLAASRPPARVPDAATAPDRRLAVVVAVSALALAAGAQVPLAIVGAGGLGATAGDARSLLRWRTRRRSP